MTELSIIQESALTVAEHLSIAKNAIDDILGEGFAAKNPSLLAAFIAASAKILSINIGLGQDAEDLAHLSRVAG